MIDVLRWSTTCVAALANGALGVEAFATPEAARLRAAEIGALTAGERAAHRIAGFDLGNSPLECTPARVAGRVICATTTNGTRALLAARDVHDVFVAGFVNLTATLTAIRALPAHGGSGARGDVDHARDARGVHIICAGSEGHVSAEDSACALALAAALEGREHALDLAALAREAPHANTLRAAGYAEDVVFALRQDSLPVVARLSTPAESILPRRILHL